MGVPALAAGGKPLNNEVQFNIGMLYGSFALLEELGFKVARPEVLLCDNNSAVLTYASEFPEWRTPTLGTKYWHSRDYVDGGEIVIRHTPGEANNSDICFDCVSYDRNAEMRKGDSAN